MKELKYGQKLVAYNHQYEGIKTIVTFERYSSPGQVQGLIFCRCEFVEHDRTDIYPFYPEELLIVIE